MALRFNIAVDDQGNPAIIKLGKNAQDSDKKLAGMGSSLGKTFGTIAASVAAAGAVIGMIGYKLAGQFKEIGNIGHDLEITSRRIGASVEFVSQFGYAMELAGASSENLDKGIKSLSQKVEKGDILFARLKISTTAAGGQLRPLKDIVLDVADRFSHMSNQTQKVAFAQELFGKQGLQLIPILNQGREAIRAQMEESERLGISWSTNAAEKAGDFEHALDRLHGVFIGIKRDTLLPMMERITPVLNILIGNFEVFKKVIEVTFKGMGKILFGSLTPPESTVFLVQKIAGGFEVLAKTILITTAVGKSIAEVFKIVGGYLAYIALAAMDAAYSIKGIFSADARAEAKTYREAARLAITDVLDGFRNIESYGGDVASVWNQINSAMEGINITKIVGGKKSKAGLPPEDVFAPLPPPDKEVKIKDIYKNMDTFSLDIMSEGLDKMLETEDTAYQEKYELLYKYGNMEAELTAELEKRKAKIRLQYQATVIEGYGRIAGALAGFMEATKSDARAIQVVLAAETIMNTSAGIMKAYAQGGVLGFLTGTAIFIEGMANLAKIRAQKFEMGGWPEGPSGPDRIPIMVTKGERVMSRREVAGFGGTQQQVDRAIASGSRGGSMNIVFNNPIGDRAFFEDYVVPMLEKVQSRR